jgi:DNA-binding MarR family transcriptional regulator
MENRFMSKRTPQGEAFSKVLVDLMYLNGLIMAKGDEMAAIAKQSSARWRVLAAIEENPKTVAQIARDLGQARQSVQRIADSLAEEKAISYISNPGDQRSDLVELKEKGRQSLIQIQSEQIKWANKMGEKMGAKSIQSLKEELERLSQALGQS